MLAECPGVVSRCGALGRGALGTYPGGSLGVGSLGARRTRNVPGRGLSAGDTWRIRVHPGLAFGFGTRGQVASSATSGGTPPAGVLGTRVALGVFRGKYHSLDSR